MTEDRNSVRNANQRIAQSYDDLPYESHAFPQCHPQRLAAVARLFGFRPPVVGSARILELGCAAGGNLIPIAARYSGAECVGVDLSTKQVQDGKERLESAGLKNVTLKCQSLTDICAEDGKFDYIIAHGVFSWVPDDVQAAIFRICQQNLSDSGVAYISYNVLPGWRMRQTLRDAFALHVGPQGTPHERVRRARDLLGFLSNFANEKSLWGRLLKEEAKALGSATTHYVAHEFLEECNKPSTFIEFMTSAQKAGLVYLGDAQPFTMLPENVGKEAAAAIRENVGRNQLAIEQYTDILTGRTFRQTLLIHHSHDQHGARRVDPGSIEQLHFLIAKDFQFERDKAGVSTFKDGRGVVFTTNDKIVKQAIQILIKRIPASTCFAEIVPELEKAGVSITPQIRANILDALYTMINCNAADISSDPITTALAISEKPIACPLMRSDASIGLQYSASLRHQPIALGDLGHILLPLLDGTNDRGKLSQALTEALVSDRIKLSPQDHQAIFRDLQKQSSSILDRFLDSMLKNGCLIG